MLVFFLEFLWVRKPASPVKVARAAMVERGDANMAKNHMSGAGHVNKHPYPDKGVSGLNKVGPSAEKGGITKSIPGMASGVKGSAPKGLK